MIETIEKEEILNMFEDKESKMIYEYRDLYNKTGNIDHIYTMCKEVLKHRGNNIDKILNQHSNKKLILFGTGGIAYELYNFIKFFNKDIDYFCDNNERKWGESFLGKKIISPQELSNMIDDVQVIIATAMSSYISEIKEQLYHMGLEEKDIIFSFDEMGMQYFDFDILPFDKMQYFLDAGCFNGDDTMDFIKYASNAKGVYAFEPDTNNFVVCKQRLEKLENVTLYPFGLWNTNSKMAFVDGAGSGSSVHSNGNKLIECVTVDSLLGEQEINYIKMDIEGSELNALYGCEQLIKRCQPYMAICLYHKPEDIYQIPLYLKKIVPNYRFYLRHYSVGRLETVLYVVK